MKLAVIALSMVCAVSVVGCGTNGSKVEASVAAAQANIKAISDKREDTKVALANKQAEAKKELVNVCASKTGIDMAVCMLGVVAVQAVGGAQNVASVESLPQMPVVQPQPGALERVFDKTLNTVVALSPLAGTIVQTGAQVKMAKINAELSAKQAEFNFLESQSRDKTVVDVVGALASQPVPSIVVGGDYIGNGSSTNRVGGDGVIGSGSLVKKNCVAGNAGSSTTPVSIQPGGPGTSITQYPSVPGGSLYVTC